MLSGKLSNKASEKRAFFSTDFFPLTLLAAKVNAHHQLGYVPHFHTIRDKQLRNVKGLTLSDKARVGKVLQQHQTLK